MTDQSPAASAPGLTSGMAWPDGIHRGRWSEVWFAGERLEPRHGQIAQAVWFTHGVRLGLNFGDCVAIARTAMEESSAF